MNPTRLQIIATTCDLLENQGFFGTGLNEIVQASGAPKGSLYYYFPSGKAEIAAEAVLHAGRLLAERVRQNLAGTENPGEALRGFIEALAGQVEASGYRAGGPLTSVASETATTNARVNAACQEAYRLLIAAFAEKFAVCGRCAEDAQALAQAVVAAIEGGIVLSRTFHSGEPLRQLARLAPAWFG